MTTRNVRKILIANRGEIATRIQKTAFKMGIPTVAVYSEADKNAAFVERATEAYFIGPSPAKDSYLRADKILDIARKSGADAIHPGYGFLSENADFADACRNADIAFIGPSGDAIRAMGLKDKAKALMADAGVPIVPGYHGDAQDLETLQKQADAIGYPVLIKAVSGGGGKGMRRVDDHTEFAEALKSAQREGQSSFNDPRVLIEKYITKPRHIEVQVFADSHGNAVHLFERDCSLQRRHQKVVEEAPAPGMSAELRQKMGDAAVKAAKAIQYEGAGTVEFIVDVANGLDKAPFYFMEMNTRLQVEHPVTEKITGTDLVAWQIHVARGEPLPRAQEDLSINGHAMEVRLYAEDPDNDFLPAIGQLKAVDFYAVHARIDTGVRSGDDISIYYDPMIAKIITHGATREDALERLITAVDQARVLGLTTNKEFLSLVLRHPEFAAGNVDTGFIPRHLETLLPKNIKPTPIHFIMGAATRLFDRERRTQALALREHGEHSPWASVDGWRLNLPPFEALRFNHQGEEIVFDVEHLADGYRINGHHVTGSLDTHFAHITIDGTQHIITAGQDDEDVIIGFQGITLHLEKAITHVEDAGDAEALDAIIAPMPGKILKINVAMGDHVKKGDVLIVLEAMKMEQSLSAARDAVVEEIPFSESDQVQEGDQILKFETQ